MPIAWKAIILPLDHRSRFKVGRLCISLAARAIQRWSLVQMGKKERLVCPVMAAAIEEASGGGGTEGKERNS